jgi:UDP-N-acetylglucosamine diphosphorylase/glucosamine-1-phosphate N-acetyltransferase
MNVVLFDDERIWKNLLPLSFTRPVSEIRFGILTIAQKWEKCLDAKISYQSQAYLSKKYPLHLENNNVFINASVCPDKDLWKAIQLLQKDERLVHNNKLIAYQGSDPNLAKAMQLKQVEFNLPILEINSLTDIFTKNDLAIVADFNALTNNKVSQPLDASVTVIGDKNKVFCAKGAKAMACVLNTQGGPIYLGKESEVMEGALVRGPFSLGEHSVLKLGAKIYGASTIGPFCKVGGELNNSVIFGFSNKAHDGFLGNSVIGEWCNLGADTNNSNLKNNYGNVKLFNYSFNQPVDTGLQFCGLIMGDYSKAGINTMFNTGTVVGVACNIFGGGFPPTHIPSFSWGGSEGFETYQTNKLFETTHKVYERRGLVFGNTEKEIIDTLFQQQVKSI